ncbi:MAG: DUF362 domain-containing protein [Syntrophaceae bacterium]
MNKVLIRKTGYDYNSLRPAVFSIMDALGGDQIGKYSQVLIKPNFLTAATPDEAVLTHPAVIRAAVEYVLEKGARALVADSPAVGSFNKLLRDNGVTEALAGLDVECRPFKNTVLHDIGHPFGKIEIAKEVFDADFIINLPKLKTHNSMLLTLGVKNTFGCIVGLRKPEWHLRTGVETERFAELLVRIHKAVNPFITVLDGILAMEGEGPGKSGKPRQLGILMGSNNAFALDRVVCTMLGVRPEALFTCNAASRLGFLAEETAVDAEGQLPRVEGFELPEIIPLVFGPRPFHGLIRKYLVRKPAVDMKRCIMCGQCREYCPAHAITELQKNLRFDAAKCIRCYCCLEVCPRGAIFSKGALAARAVDMYLKKRRMISPETNQKS